MFREVLRVLSAAGGRYLCITLAEPFIFRHLLQHFAGSVSGSAAASLSLHLVDRDRPQSPAAASPFVPILAEVVRKSDGGKAGSPPPQPLLHFDRFGGRTRSGDGQSASLQAAAETVAHLQEFRQMRFRLG